MRLVIHGQSAASMAQTAAAEKGGVRLIADF